MDLEYEFVGWTYYSSEVFFKLAHFGIACVFLFTAIKFGVALELAKVSREQDPFNESISLDGSSD